MGKTKAKFTRWFKVSGEDREFMYYVGATSRKALEPHIKAIKRKGDLYRVTKWKGGYELWDARR